MKKLWVELKVEISAFLIKKTGPFNLNDPVCTRDGNRTRTAAMATGFSYHYGFRHLHPLMCLWSGLSLHPITWMSPVKSLHLLLFMGAWLGIATFSQRFPRV